MSDDVLKNWQSTTEILFSDVLRAAGEVERVGDGCVRRNYVRAVFAAIEGITHGMKRVVLQTWKYRQSALNANDLERLTEMRFEKGKSKKRFSLSRQRQVCL